MGLDYALPIGILTGVLSFVPFLGFGLGMILALLVALLQFSDWTGVAWVAGIYLAGQALESYVVTPRLVGERVGLHPVAVIFALAAFGQLFGFVGVLLAVPLAAVLLVALRELRGVYEASAFYRGSYNAGSPDSASSAMSAPLLGQPLLESRIASLPLVHRGKVRDIYAVGDDKLLIVTTDRLSAFDVVMPTPIPGKGEVLTRVSAFWFDKLKAIVPSQALDIAPGIGRRGKRARPGRRPRHRGEKTQGAAGRSHRARLSGRLRLEGIPGQPVGVRHRAARRPEAGRPPARTDLHAVDQGGGRRPRREHRIRANGRADRRRPGEAGARRQPRPV